MASKIATMIKNILKHAGFQYCLNQNLVDNDLSHSGYKPNSCTKERSTLLSALGDSDTGRKEPTQAKPLLGVSFVGCSSRQPSAPQVSTKSAGFMRRMLSGTAKPVLSLAL